MIRRHLILCFVIATAPAAAQQATPAPVSQNVVPGGTGPDIVVTGTPLKDAQAALARCLSTHCPPDRDINATLAVAEAQFVAGDYKAARAETMKSINRNKRFAKSYPVAVSDLLRANSRIAVHLGEDGAYRSGALDVISALKAGLPDTDQRVLAARIELGDALLDTGKADDALDLYRKVAHQARDLHYDTVEAYALLRIAGAYAAMSRTRNDAYYSAAIKACDTVSAHTDAATAPIVGAARLLKAKLSVKNGDPGAVDALVETYRTLATGVTTPVLLYSPKIEQPELSGRETGGGETLNRMALGNFEAQWVDIGFEVGNDGKVSDTEVLRQSPSLSGTWFKPILTAIAGRRYAPLAAGAPPVPRVERYTYTAAWATETGSRIRVRSPIPKIERLDLSRDTPPTPAKPG